MSVKLGTSCTNKDLINSASWGPTDDGKTVDGPRNTTMRAIVRGVNEVSGSKEVMGVNEVSGGNEVSGVKEVSNTTMWAIVRGVNEVSGGNEVSNTTMRAIVRGVNEVSGGNDVRGGMRLVWQRG